MKGIYKKRGILQTRKLDIALSSDTAWLRLLGSSGALGACLIVPTRFVPPVSAAQACAM
jgi:hypothetical protein